MYYYMYRIHTPEHRYMGYIKVVASNTNEARERAELCASNIQYFKPILSFVNRYDYETGENLWECDDGDYDEYYEMMLQQRHM